MRYGIAFKLGLLLATFGVVAMGIVGYYSYASSRATLLAAAQRDLLTATQVLGRNLHATIHEVSSDALVLASLSITPTLAAAPGGEVSERGSRMLADTFSSILAVHPDYFQIRLIGAGENGLERVRVDRDGNQLTRVQGDELQEKAHYAYVYNTLKLGRGQVYLSSIDINHEEGAHAGLNKPTVRVATPVVAADGRVQGLIVINLDLNSLFERLKSDLPNAYQVYLSNHWGDYLIHPAASQTFGFDQGRRVFIQETFAPVAALLDGKSASVVTRTDASELVQDGLVAAFVRLPFGGSVANHFVILGVSQPLEHVLRETRALGWTTVQMILALGGVAVLLAALVARVVTGRLRAMVQEVERFSTEHVVRELPSTRKDEIGLLARSLNRMQVTLVETMRELNESRHALKHLAQHDVLTGLPNRALFNDRLQQAVAQARREQLRMALLFVDLDGFKVVNDTHGHHVGDLLLVEVAQRMEACVRKADTVARLGGDEFVVLLPLVDGDQAALRVADKVCQALWQVFELDGLQLRISASIGVVVYPDHGSDENRLSQSADVAMYQAKTSGGNCVRLFGVGQ